MKGNHNLKVSVKIKLKTVSIHQNLFLHLTIVHVSLASTEWVGLLTTLELICLWIDLLKWTGWQTKPLELVEKEQLQLTILLTDSLT